MGYIEYGRDRIKIKPNAIFRGIEISPLDPRGRDPCSQRLRVGSDCFGICHLAMEALGKAEGKCACLGDSASIAD
ncbi:hypothetical protein ASD52_27685 [Ensifer sp. Root142]|nr:hypothetical protein ASD52_27685 [Ensifer sp. Root142]